MTGGSAAGGDVAVAALRARAEDLAARLRQSLLDDGLDGGALDRSLAARVEAALRVTKRPFTSLVADLERVPLAGPAGDAALAGRQNRLLAAMLTARYSVEGAQIAMPASLHDGYRLQQERVLLGLEERTDPAFYSLANDDFLKELAIVSHRLVWHGRGFSDPWGRVQREVFFSGGWRQFVRALRLFGPGTRGLGPFLTVHIHALAPPAREGPEGWVNSHRGLASIVALNPWMRGEAGGGWIMDPQLARITPMVAYRREVIVDGGAKLFFLRRDTEGTSGALTASDSRKELFERGEYVPEIWVYAWPRKRLLSWVKAQGS